MGNEDYAKTKDIEIAFKQSNIEGEIVSCIQESNEKFDVEFTLNDSLVKLSISKSKNKE